MGVIDKFGRVYRYIWVRNRMENGKWRYRLAAMIGIAAGDD